QKFGKFMIAWVDNGHIVDPFLKCLTQIKAGEGGAAKGIVKTHCVPLAILADTPKSRIIKHQRRPFSSMKRRFTKKSDGKSPRRPEKNQKLLDLKQASEFQVFIPDNADSLKQGRVLCNYGIECEVLLEG